MSTRAVIAAKCGDGSCKAVYVHYDGYGLWPILQENYNSQDKVDALVALGDLSSLGDSLETCKAYGRDNGKAVEITVLDRLDDALTELDWGQEYIYLWDGSGWSQVDCE